MLMGVTFISFLVINCIGIYVYTEKRMYFQNIYI